MPTNVDNSNTDGNHSLNSFPKIVRRFRHTLTKLLRAGPEKWLVSAGFRIIPGMSRSGVIRLSGALAAVLYPFSRGSRRIINANLDVVYGPADNPAEREKLVKSIMANSMRVILDCFWFAKDGSGKLAEYVSYDDGYAAMINGRDPELAVTGHFGSWELSAQCVCSKGRTLTSVFAPIGNAETQERMAMMRRANGQNIVPKNGAVLAMLRALHENQLVGLLLDQRTPTTKGGVFVNFLGLKTTISNVAGTLSVRRKVPVNIVWCKYLGDGYYRCELVARLEAGHGMSDAGVSQWIADRLGEIIKANPEQWLWMYRRWRHYPPGEDPAKYPYYAMPYNPLVD